MAQEERPLRVVRKIVIYGSTDLVLCRGRAESILVASEDPEWLSRIHTNVVGDKLRIKQGPIVLGRTNIPMGKGNRVTQTFHPPIQQGVYAAPRAALKMIGGAAPVPDRPPALPVLRRCPRPTRTRAQQIDMSAGRLVGCKRPTPFPHPQQTPPLSPLTPPLSLPIRGRFRLSYLNWKRPWSGKKLWFWAPGARLPAP